MAIYLRKNKKLTEDDANQQQVQTASSQGANVAAAAEIEKCNLDIVKCQNAINNAEKKYQEEKTRQNNNIAQLQKRIAELGGTALSQETVNDSLKQGFRLSKKLFEAVQTGRTDELIRIIETSFYKLPSISFVMDKKQCVTLAKRLLSFLNDQVWNDGESHWDEVEDFLLNVLRKANVSFSSRETSQFTEMLSQELQKSTMFSWIFGRMNYTPNYEQDSYDDIEDTYSLDSEEPIDDLDETDEDILYDDRMKEIL